LRPAPKKLGPVAEALAVVAALALAVLMGLGTYWLVGHGYGRVCYANGVSFQIVFPASASCSSGD
jgi:hypothetical protein